VMVQESEKRSATCRTQGVNSSCNARINAISAPQQFS